MKSFVLLYTTQSVPAILDELATRHVQSTKRPIVTDHELIVSRKKTTAKQQSYILGYQVTARTKFIQKFSYNNLRRVF